VLILPSWFMRPLRPQPGRVVGGGSQPGKVTISKQSAHTRFHGGATQPFRGLFLENGIASACGDSQKLIA
jgi:hypothetical protein